MGIFSKKYDYEIDGIKYEFDLAQDRYCFFKDGKIIEDKNMNLRSRRFLKNKNDMSEEQKDQNREIAQSVEKMKEEKEKTKKAIENRKANGIDLKYSSFEVMTTLKPKLSKEVEKYLENLTCEEENDKYVVGIHRIGSSEEHLENILNSGILVQGHMMGAAKGTPELNNTVGFYPLNSTIIKEVGFAYTYKDSKGSVVVKIPKEDIVQNKLYVVDKDGNTYLNSKYTVGYFPIEADKSVDKIVTKDNLKDYMNKRVEEAKEYIDISEKTVEHSPKEK